MATVLARLRSDLGIPEPYVRATVLPDWWDDSIADSESGYAEVRALFAHRFGVHPSAWSGTAPLRAQSELNVRFKKRAADVVGAASIGLEVAKLVASSMSDTPMPIADATALRDQILARHPRVDLDALVDTCWSIGLPVIHLATLPEGPRMQGMAARFGNRHVVVLAGQHRQPAWQLFTLAHELGHVARGHLGASGVLAEEAVDLDAADSQEQEATSWASELLVGRRSIPAPSRLPPNATVFASAVREQGKRWKADPGHLALLFAHLSPLKPYPLANAALAQLVPNANAPADLRRAFWQRIDASALSEDDLEYLEKVVGKD